MEFDRSALIAAIDRAIEQDRAAVEAVQKRNEEMNAEHRKEWMALHFDKWMVAAARIRSRLRKGEPVTENDIPRDRSGYSGMAFYRPRRGETVPTLTTELAGLRAVLDAIADTTISTSALRSLGVGVNTLRKVVPLLGTASVQARKMKGDS